MLQLIKKIRYKLFSYFPKESPFLWLYAAYLTLRYVDESHFFPAIKFNSLVWVKFYKSNGSKIIIKNKLIFESFVNDTTKTIITTHNNATILVKNDFVLGGGIKILVCKDGLLSLGGKIKETASGITADATVLVRKHVEIGEDCLIAWDTFITDSDWHQVGNKILQSKTSIGNHVWIGVGVKILKGAIIGNNIIITTNSVVLNGTYPDQVMISGIPGKVTKENIENWVR
jgi:acetyltransferase-like isoleucine patch superfamily enzyme